MGRLFDLLGISRPDAGYSRWTCFLVRRKGNWKLHNGTSIDYIGTSINKVHACSAKTD